MKRRDFLKAAAQMGLFSIATSALPWRAFAQAAPDAKPQFFILIDVPGGWDTSLSTDPWTKETRLDEKDYFIEYRHDEIIPFNNSFVGPALLPLKNYFDRMTILNGIFMTSNDGGHPSASLYITSGNGQGQLGVLPLELEGKLFNSPFGTLSDTAIYAGGKNKTVWDINDVVRTGTIGGAELLVDFNDRSTDLSQARKAILQNSSRIEVFNNVMASSTEKNEAAALIAAFRSGLSSSGFLSTNVFNLDTHSGHRNTHLTGLTESFAEIAKVIDALKNSPGVDSQTNVIESNTLLDQTTIMITSEFARTPALNGSGGKDHNPQNNSTILISPKMRAGTFGSSRVVERKHAASGTPYLAGLPWDLKTQQVVNTRQNSFIVRPENAVATVLTSLAVDPAAISKGLGSAEVLTSLFK